MSDVDATSSRALQKEPVTTTDLLKLVGITLVLVDHHGYFFDPLNPWWRVFGRVAAPIFFFLIGFSRTRRVPWTWFAFGILITAVAAWRAGSLSGNMINILISFALLRALVLLSVEQHVMSRPWAVGLLIAGCLPLIPVTYEWFEYGTLGWLWAFFGLSHRLALTENTSRVLWTRNGIAGVAASAYLFHEAQYFGFTRVQTAILIVLIVGLCAVLMRFCREPLTWQPPAPLRAPFRFCGHYSLEIYGISVLASHVLARALGP